MPSRIAVVTNNDYLWQKIRLTLAGTAECVRADASVAVSEYDLCLWDTDNVGDAAEGAVTMGLGAAELSLPLSFEDILLLVAGGDAAPPLTKGERCAYLRGERIALTDVEFSLFEILYSAEGEFVSREELLSRVWGKASPGVVNVYVHYLREKLERGEKIIVSSRKAGYKIDERFIK